MGGLGEERNIDGNPLIFNQFPHTLPFNLQVSLICRRRLKMSCQAALNPLVRSPGWCFVLSPHAIAAVSRFCMYERKRTFLIMLISMCPGVPMLFPYAKRKIPSLTSFKTYELWSELQLKLYFCCYFLP